MAIRNNFWPFGTFYVYLVYIMALWYIFFVPFVYLIPLWYVVPRKIWQPGPRTGKANKEGLLLALEKKTVRALERSHPELPEMSWHNIPKRWKIYHATTKFTK
jgi:hypothetical protein